MFTVNQIVHSQDGETGVITLSDPTMVRVQFADGTTEDFPADTPHLRPGVSSLPAPSVPADPIHAYYLTHARNAGAAVEALRIIRNDAHKALNKDGPPDLITVSDTLIFIEGFADDVLRSILPE